MTFLALLVDTRELKPFRFNKIDPRPKIETVTLETGDYSIRPFQKEIVIERKSLPDLFGSVGRERKRFEKEMGRLAEFQYAAVVVEGDWQAILRNPPRFTKMNPKSVFSTVVAWEQRYGVSFWMCPNRAFAEKLTYRILERLFFPLALLKSSLAFSFIK